MCCSHQYLSIDQKIVRPINRPQTSKNRIMNADIFSSKNRKYERGYLENYERIGKWDLRFRFRSLVSSASLLRFRFRSLGRRAILYTRICHAHSNAHKPSKPVASTICMLDTKF